MLNNRLKIQRYNVDKKVIKENKVSKNIAFILNDEYVKYLAVIVAMIKRRCTFEITIIILFDKLSDENIKKISRLCEKNKFEIILIDLFQSNTFDLEDGRSKYWFSSMAKKILLTTSFFDNIGTILYLDIDISIVGNIDELFTFNKYPIYAVVELASITIEALKWVMPKTILPHYILDRLGKEVTLKKYFEFVNVMNYINAGVLVINPKFCNINIPLNEVLNFSYSDQDWINKNFNNSIYIINYKWNLSASFLYKKNNLLLEDNFVSKDEYHKLKIDLCNKKIIHYAGYTKPWEIFFLNYKKWDWQWIIATLFTNYKYQIWKKILINQNKIFFGKIQKILGELWK